MFKKKRGSSRIGAGVKKSDGSSRIGLGVKKSHGSSRVGSGQDGFQNVTGRAGSP